MKSQLLTFVAVIFMHALSASADQYVTPPRKGFVVDSIENHPIPETVKEFARKKHAQLREKGEISSQTEEEVPYIENYITGKWSTHFLPMDIISARIAITPAQIDPTYLNLEFVGASTAGALVENKWTGLERVYKGRTGVVVVLEEVDYVLASGGGVISKEFINEEINGNPAIIITTASPKGRAITQVGWVDRDRIFTLKITGNAKKAGLSEALIATARSLRW